MMTVEFHTGVTDPVAFACRLLRKAHRQGARVLVTAPAQRLMELDRALWQEPEREFIPHVRMPGAASRVALRTPIWLTAEAALAGAPRTLVNLGLDTRFDAMDLDRVIEVVAADPDEADAGRQRWRAYRASGQAVRHHGAS